MKKIAPNKLLILWLLYIWSSNSISQTWVCGDDLIDVRNGRQYNTVQIDDRCWMAENINIGIMIDGDSSLANNNIIEKFCFENDSINCELYGGMYNWNEMMLWDTIESCQGICPDGWHIPSDSEIFDLETFFDSTITDPFSFGLRGTDAGKKLKMGGISGFNFLLGGSHYFHSKGFIRVGYTGGLLSSSQFSSFNALGRGFIFNEDQTGRETKMKHHAYSIRCLKDSSSSSCLPMPSISHAGHDQLFVTDTFVYLQSNVPIFGSGVWSLSSGLNGNFSNIYSNTSTFFGIPGQTYKLVWSISTNCNTSNDTLIIRFLSPFSQDIACGDTLIDIRDGQKYPTVKIGEQCWMKENLNIGNKIIIDTANFTQQLDNNVIEKYCLKNKDSKCNIYGGLYQWDEMMQYSSTSGSQGICPSGWHIPTISEYYTLIDYYGGNEVASGPLMDTSTEFWAIPNNIATNASRFSALGTGYIAIDGSSKYEHDIELLWSSSENTIGNAWRIGLSSNTERIYKLSSDKLNAKSVRCIKNPCSPQPTYSNAGADQIIQGKFASLNANTPFVGLGMWSIEDGVGGHLQNDTLPTTLFKGIQGNTYILKWTISNTCGSSEDFITISLLSSFSSCGDTLTDYRDGRKYSTIQIGSQCWMVENLNIGIFIPSTNTPGLIHSDLSNNNIFEKYCYNNDTGYCSDYGGLYDWDELMKYNTMEGFRGICPNGWHIPTDLEFYNLENFVDTNINDPNLIGWRGIDAAVKMQNGGSSGFNSLFAGYRDKTGSFKKMNNKSFFWTSSEISTQKVWHRQIHNGYYQINRDELVKKDGLSIRCILNSNNKSYSFENKEDIRIKLFPNPTSGKLEILWNSVADTKYNIVITNLMGNILFNRSITLDNEQKLTLDISDFPANVYLVKVFNKEIYTINKIIIIK